MGYYTPNEHQSDSIIALLYQSSHSVQKQVVCATIIGGIYKCCNHKERSTTLSIFYWKIYVKVPKYIRQKFRGFRTSMNTAPVPFCIFMKTRRGMTSFFHCTIRMAQTALNTYCALSRNRSFPSTLLRWEELRCFRTVGIGQRYPPNCMHWKSKGSALDPETQEGPLNIYYRGVKGSGVSLYPCIYICIFVKVGKATEGSTSFICAHHLAPVY